MIKTDKLSKQYKGSEELALDNISLEIKSNTVFGLLGQNGAGKSSFMNILTTIIEQSSGTVIIDNIEVTPKNYEVLRRKIGYMPQEFDMYPNLKVVDILTYFGLMRDIKKKELNNRIRYLLDEFNLANHSQKTYKQLSGGMKRRVGFAIALLHDPEILVIDEPTVGVDPEERASLRDLIIHIGETKTVIFSTHIIEDIEQTSDALAIFHDGKLKYNGNLEMLLSLHKGRLREIDLKEVNLDEVECDCEVLMKYKTSSGQKAKVLVKNENVNLGTTIETSLEDAFLALCKEEV